LHHNHLIALGMVISTAVQKLADIAKQLIMCNLCRAYQNHHFFSPIL